MVGLGGGGWWGKVVIDTGLAVGGLHLLSDGGGCGGQGRHDRLMWGGGGNCRGGNMRGSISLNLTRYPFNY